MTRDPSETGRPSGLSRRRLLAGIGGVGAVGTASGLGTGAYLTDRETFASNGFGAGEVELTVDGAPAGGTVSLGVSGIDRGESGREAFDVGVRANPVRVWLATDCPAVDDALANALEVEFVVDGESVTGGYRPLADAARDHVAGGRLAEGCLDPTGAVTVEVFWRLPVDAPDGVAGAATDLTFRLHAEQCRHVSEADAAGSNPFAGRVCEGPECVPCEDENGVTIGSLTLRYLGDEEASVAAAAVGGGAGGKGTGGTVIFAGEVGPNETFVLEGSDSPTNGDPNWLGPNVYVDAAIDGDPGDATDGVRIHTSCSVALAPGDVYGAFEVVAVTTTDGEPVCGSEEN
ncbi:hypothetical protein CK500_02020 [Halorubrum salipaludis]|uniref:DUF7467 domain-containing protein n=1 Tax=Halorubrum salipaludis TaxID=2032630 RepID=A0A2A2FJ07_9EURY|nr:hypothetical protein [Halorubrum salipaludis]PAU85471.1 hypothetical protein CK500_02020 [Halorubrum salipaludis]